MKTKTPLRFVISSALLAGSLSACGASPPPDEARPETNERMDEEEEYEEAEPRHNAWAEELDPEPERAPDFPDEEELAE